MSLSRFASRTRLITIRKGLVPSSTRLYSPKQFSTSSRRRNELEESPINALQNPMTEAVLLAPTEAQLPIVPEGTYPHPSPTQRDSTSGGMNAIYPLESLAPPIMPMYSVHVKATNNNTIISFHDDTGNTLGISSGGTCRYKKVNRSTYEAGHACAVTIFRRIEQVHEHLSKGLPLKDVPRMRELTRVRMNPETRGRPRIQLRVTFSGFGIGREAFNSAMTSAEGNFVQTLVTEMQDRSPIKIGGCRGKKVRRV